MIGLSLNVPSPEKVCELVASGTGATVNDTGGWATSSPVKIVDVFVYVYHMSVRVEGRKIANLWGIFQARSHGNSSLDYARRTHLVEEIPAIEWVNYCP